MNYPENSGKPDIWTVAEAKAKFSELLERTQFARPQTVTRHGRPVAVVVAASEWEKKTKRRGSLAQFLAASPLRGAKLDLSRKADDWRPLEL